MGRALQDSWIAQWVEHFGEGDSSVGRALRDSEIAQRLARALQDSWMTQWVEHYRIAG